MMNEYVELRNGVKMPILGFGTFLVKNGQTTVDAVKTALKIGYKHIDCASRYENEDSVGIAIKESGIPR